MVTAGTSTIVKLTDEEWGLAVEMGTKRHEWAEDRSLLQTDGTRSRNGLFNHIRGAGGEIATAKWYEVPWDATLNGFKRISDLLGCEIRSTAPDTPYLRIKKRDKPNGRWPFISTTYLGNRQYQVEGWIYGYVGMVDKYYVPVDPHSKKPEWHVPFCDLNYPFRLQNTLWKLRDLKKGVREGIEVWQG